MDDLDDWRMLEGRVSAWFDAPATKAGAALVSRVAELTDELPVLDVRAGGVRVRTGDREVASAVAMAARELGLVADPAVLQSLRVAVGAIDKASVMGFWQAALGYEPFKDSLEDPARRDPAFSFHQLEEPRPLRNRIHVDVVRPADEVDAVRKAVDQEPYGAYGVALADVEGNEADVVPGDRLTEEPDTADWRVVFSAMAFYPITSPQVAGRLVTAAATLADDAGVPLMIDVRPDGVTIDTGKDQWEDSEGSPRPEVVELAARIQTAARELGLTADPTRLRLVQLAIDAVDVPAVRAFWTTLLGYQQDPRPDLADIYDPRRLNPVFMFQQTDRDRLRQRNRIRFELAVPQDQAQARIDAALAAGGRIVNGRLLADPEGNEVEILTQS